MWDQSMQITTNNTHQRVDSYKKPANSKAEMHFSLGFGLIRYLNCVISHRKPTHSEAEMHFSLGFGLFRYLNV